MGRLLDIFFGFRVRRKSSRQRGLTLMEVALGLGVLAIGAASMAEHMADNARTIRTAAAASKLNEVHQAADRMVAERFDDIVSAIGGPGGMIVIPVGRASAGAAIPTGPAGLPSLQGGGYLSPSYVDRNSYNQRHAVLVKDTSVDPDNPRLSVLVTTWDGMPITDEHLARMSGFIGAHGGVMLQNPPGGTPANTVMGSFGGWQAAVADWSANWSGNNVSPSVGRAASHFVMSRDERGIRVNEFLHRYDVPGQPELNQMHTDLSLEGNDINNINHFSSKSGFVDGDLDVTNNLTVGNDLSVANNIEGQDLVARRHVIAQSGDVNSGRHVIAQNDVVSQTGNVRAQNNISTVNGDVISGRDILANRHLEVDGQAWIAGHTTIGLADGSNVSLQPELLRIRGGHININNRMTLGRSSHVGTAPDIWFSEAGSINADGAINISTTNPDSVVRFSSGSSTDLSNVNFLIRGNGRAEAYHGMLIEDDLEVERDATVGNRLTVGGISAPASAATGDIVAKDIWLDDVQRWASEGVYYANIVSSNQNVPKPKCRSGATPHIFLSPVFFSDNGNGRPLLGVRALAQNYANHWQTQLVVFTPDASGTGVEEVTVNASYGRMMALVKCMV